MSKTVKKLWGYPVYAWVILALCNLVFAPILYLAFPHTIPGFKGWVGFIVMQGCVTSFSLYALGYQIRKTKKEADGE